jgi:hypothetical protein
VIVKRSASGYLETARSLVDAIERRGLLGYRDPRELSGTYDVAQHLPTLEQMATLLDQLAAEAAGG